MKQELFTIIEKFYKKLHDNVLRSEKRFKNDSVLLTLIKITSNKTSKLLNDSSVKATIFPLDDLRMLDKDGYIRVSDDKNKLNEYILTAQGIFRVENFRKDLDINSILEFFQKKYFSFSDVGKSLTETEKIILLSMIGARVFSIDSLMHLKTDIVQNYWLDIFKESYEFLFKHNVIKKSDLKFEKQGNEHPISYAMRRANHLPRKTQHVFIFLSNKKYYLDLADNDELSEFKLKRIFELIFRKIDEISLIENILAFCNDIAYQKGKYVKKDFLFIESRYDGVIKDILKQIYLD